MQYVFQHGRHLMTEQERAALDLIIVDAKLGGNWDPSPGFREFARRQRALAGGHSHLSGALRTKNGPQTI